MEAILLTLKFNLYHQMIISVFRKGHFNAAHRLNVAEWDAETNKKIFGLCNNENFHGHNYEITVKVTGEIDQKTGMLIDTTELKKIIKEQVEDAWDHQNMNIDVPEFKNLNPTAENMAIIAWQKIRKHIPLPIELTIILHETERNFVEYSGK